MILSFSVSGFRCFAEKVTLDLKTNSFRHIRSSEGETWTDYTLRTAAIFGANASGKTTLIDAIWALSSALRNSRRSSSRRLYQPTASSRRPNPVSYEVEFVAAGVRYQYKLTLELWGVSYEALHSFPMGRPRKLFIRSQPTSESKIQFESGTSLTGPTAEVQRLVQSPHLFLGVAAEFGHKTLAPIAACLSAGGGVEMLSLKDSRGHAMVTRVVQEMLDAPEEQSELIQAILQAGDLGLSKIEIQSMKLPPRFAERMEPTNIPAGDDPEEQVAPRVLERLVFHHRNQDGDAFTLPISQQSAGTLTWLTISWHALTTIRKGGVLLVDEIDASLHPALVRYIIDLFQDRHTNPHGAQLIFTSHDISLLGNTPKRLLAPKNVWFVAKGVDSTSELYSLDDFDNRKGNNNEKRYAVGVFGAVPTIDDYLLDQFLTSTFDEASRG